MLLFEENKYDPKQADIPEIMPEGVELRDWEDFDTLRTQLYDGAVEEIQKSFPKSYGGVRLEVNDLHYADPENFSLDDQKKAIIEGGYLTRRLRGTYKLVDENTNEPIEERKMTLAKVPYLTQRGTFIHNGSEYNVINQQRLRPGIYTRKKKTGELETHFNPRRGTGGTFRVGLEPETGVFRMQLDGSNLKLYSVLKILGVDDDKMKETWGERLWDLNKKADDPRILDKLYSKTNRYGDKNAPAEEKIKSIREYFEKPKFERATVSRTLANLLEKQAGTSSRGCLMLKFDDSDAKKIQSWAKEHIPEDDVWGDGFESDTHITLRYGFNEDRVEDLRNKFSGEDCTFTLGPIERFEQEDHDVLFISLKDDSECQKRHEEINEEFKDILDELTHPDYKPHVTLAYVKKGACKELDNHDRFTGELYTLTKFNYSSAGSEKKEIL